MLIVSWYSIVGTCVNIAFSQEALISCTGRTVMKVSNSGVDSVEISNLSRSKQSGKIENKKAESENSKAQADSSSKVEISSDAKVLAKGIDAAKDAQLTDAERIAEIKEKIAAKQYNPDYGRVADKLLEEHILNS